jgi:hypothetical protein
VGIPARKLSLSTGAPPARRAAICPLTGVTIPECSCQRCIEEQIRHHSPALLDRRFGGGRARRAA